MPDGRGCPAEPDESVEELVVGEVPDGAVGGRGAGCVASGDQQELRWFAPLRERPGDGVRRERAETVAEEGVRTVDPASDQIDEVVDQRLPPVLQRLPQPGAMAG